MPSRLVASAPFSATTAGTVAHRDVVDANVVKRHRRHSREAICGLREPRKIEALRREA